MLVMAVMVMKVATVMVVPCKSAPSLLAAALLNEIEGFKNETFDDSNISLCCKVESGDYFTDVLQGNAYSNLRGPWNLNPGE